MKILGIDEAGRGCVIGPLVVCGYMIDEKDIFFGHIKDELKDSKKLSGTKREEFYNLLVNNQNSKIYLQTVSASQINIQMKNLVSLNDIEERCAINIVCSSNAEKIYIDCFSKKKNFAKIFKKKSSKYRQHDFFIPYKEKKSEEFIYNGKKINNNKKFFIEFKADEKYKIVSAASILAKVKRDAYIKKINKKYAKHGFIVGSGYPSDKTTIVFLKQYFKKFGKMPEETRIIWKTIKNIEQRTLFNLFL